MCTVSMTYDHFRPKIPWPTEQQWNPAVPMDELKKIIEEFREAVAAAKKVDKLTGQPDCVDPEKAKLEERVAILERRIEDLEAFRERIRGQ